MIVCVCHRVSEHSITRAARAGMSFDDIQLELGVATQCGQCESGARALVSECCNAAPVAHIKLDSHYSDSPMGRTANGCQAQG